ncbi:MAG: type I secretion system permease/ATPase [Marinovum algicola]
MRDEAPSLIVFSFFANLLLLVSSIYMLQVFDRVLSSGSLSTLAWLTVIAVVATAAYALLELARRSQLSRIGGWLEAELSAPLLERSLDRRVAGHRPMASLADIRDVKAFVGGDQVLAFLDAPWMPVFIAVIWLLDPVLGVIAAVGAGVLFVFALVNDRVTRGRAQRAAAAAQQGQVAAQRLLDQAETVLALGMGRGLLRRWTEGQAAAQADGLRAADTTTGIFNLSRFVRLALQVVILGAGAWLVLEGRLTAGGMIAASIILARALSPVERSIGAWRAYVQARAAHRNLAAFFEAGERDEERVRLPAPAGHLEVAQARYAAPGTVEPILKQVSFALAPGEVCGVVGPSGSGKSSLCRLLVGIWRPGSGHVRLDGADVAAWEQADLARHVGYLPQQVELFPGTVAQNIARMGPVDSDAVLAAAKRADVHRLILALPDGYETDVGVHGGRLSGGQRQRLGLARALYGEPRLVVLDEPNSNLDRDGEAALFETVAQLAAEGRTVVLVAHHPAALKRVDKLLVLRDGTSVAFGPRDAVLAKLRAGQRVVPMGAAAKPAPEGPARQDGYAGVSVQPAGGD